MTKLFLLIVLKVLFWWISTITYKLCIQDTPITRG